MYGGKRSENQEKGFSWPVLGDPILTSAQMSHNQHPGIWRVREKSPCHMFNEFFKLFWVDHYFDSHGVLFFAGICFWSWFKRKSQKKQPSGGIRFLRQARMTWALTVIRFNGELTDPVVNKQNLSSGFGSIAEFPDERLDALGWVSDPKKHLNLKQSQGNAYHMDMSFKSFAPQNGGFPFGFPSNPPNTGHPQEGHTHVPCTDVGQGLEIRLRSDKRHAKPCCPKGSP